MGFVLNRVENFAWFAYLLILDTFILFYTFIHTFTLPLYTHYTFPIYFYTFLNFHYTVMPFSYTFLLTSFTTFMHFFYTFFKVLNFICTLFTLHLHTFYTSFIHFLHLIYPIFTLLHSLNFFYTICSRSWNEFSFILVFKQTKSYLGNKWYNLLMGYLVKSN